MPPTIILIDHRPAAISYYQCFTDTKQCIIGFVESFNQYMMKKYSRVNYLEIHRYIDGIHELKCYVLNYATNQYQRYGKEWFTLQIDLYVTLELGRERRKHKALGNSKLAIQKELERRLYAAKVRPADQKKK